MALRNDSFAAVYLVVALAACHSDKPAPVAPEAQAATTAAIAPVPSASAPSTPPASSAAPGSAALAVDAAAPNATPAPEKPAPVSCKTDDDCWFDDDKKPIARPKAMRGKKIVPCKSGGTHSPACADGACVVRAWKC